MLNIQLYVQKDGSQKVKFKNASQLKITKMLKELEEQAGDYGGLTVGVQEDAQPYPKDKNTADVAQYMEEGTKKFEGYKWLSQSLKYQDYSIEKGIEALLKEFPKSPSVFLIGMEALGRKIVGSVQNIVYSNLIDLKNPNTATPAVDSKHMIESVDYKVVGYNAFK